MVKASACPVRKVDKKVNTEEPSSIWRSISPLSKRQGRRRNSKLLRVILLLALWATGILFLYFSWKSTP
jgi:hypothetical protein